MQTGKRRKRGGKRRKMKTLKEKRVLSELGFIWLKIPSLRGGNDKIPQYIYP